MRLLALGLILLLSKTVFAVNLEDPNLKIGRGSESQGQYGSINEPSTLDPIPLDKIILLPDELQMRLPTTDGEDDDESDSEQ